MASTANLAGAVAAIMDRLTAQWNTTPIVFDNLDPQVEIPPLADGVPQPWVFCEVVGMPSEIVAFGRPGDQTVIDDGNINLYVMVQKGGGLTPGWDYAVALGELFRQQKFYTTDPTAYIRSLTPSVMRGDMTSDDGNQVSVLCRIPFEFYHRA
jgi:hypothetical protein